MLLLLASCDDCSVSFDYGDDEPTQKPTMECGLTKGAGMKKPSCVCIHTDEYGYEDVLIEYPDVCDGKPLYD